MFLSSMLTFAHPGMVAMRGKGESGVSWFHNPLRFFWTIGELDLVKTEGVSRKSIIGRPIL